MAECAKGVYRPRQPRETPFYRIVEEHFERFEQIYPERYEDRYGYLRPVIRETVYKYLNCGDLKLGFARVRCTDCGHEYLLAFSCKGRYFCTSCHTKRAVAFAEWLHTTIMLPVPHRQIVLTIPKMLRIYFRYDRRLLGDLCRVAAGVIVESFRVLLAAPQAQPGLVVCVHTYGDLLNHHPHLHVMATDGAFTPDGAFHALPTMSLAPMEELFRHRVCKLLIKKGLLSAERVKLMESWEHSGFNIDASVRIGADDATGRENLARYLIRAPFSGERISYNVAEGTVIYQTKRSTGTNANEVLFDPLDFLAAVTSHIPNRGEHLVRYYSYYSSVQRSRRRRQELEKQPLGPLPIPLSDDIAAAKTARGNWARFIKKVFELDPLLCPDCGGLMKIISFIEDPHVRGRSVFSRPVSCVVSLQATVALFFEANALTNLRSARRIAPITGQSTIQRASRGQDGSRGAKGKSYELAPPRP